MEKYQKWQKVDPDEEPHYTSLGAKCEWKICCYVCDRWSYALLNLGNEDNHKCQECVLDEKYPHRHEIDSDLDDDW